MATIQLRRGTTAQWLETTNILALGEPGFDTVTGDLKLGDGVSRWEDLPNMQGIPGPPGKDGSSGFPPAAELPEGYVVMVVAGVWSAGPPPAGSGGPTGWGELEGELANQTDLVLALNARVPGTRKINGKALTADLALTASDVGAAASNDPRLTNMRIPADDSVTDSKVAQISQSKIVGLPAALASKMGAEMPSKFGGVIVVGSEPTPPNDGAVHWAFRVPA